MREPLEKRVCYRCLIRDLAEGDYEERIGKYLAAIAEDEKAKGFLLGVARSEQGIRGASNVFSNAVDNGNITYAGLLSMAKAMKLKVF